MAVGLLTVAQQQRRIVEARVPVQQQVVSVHAIVYLIHVMSWCHSLQGCCIWGLEEEELRVGHDVRGCGLLFEPALIAAADVAGRGLGG